MLQAIGLTTSAPRRGLRAAVDDLTFEARPGQVTALLGAPGSGKTAALRLMLELDSGRGSPTSGAGRCTGSRTPHVRWVCCSETYRGIRPGPLAASSGCSAPSRVCPWHGPMSCLSS